tara:strand:- start:54 stop:581 length:528 start_codon:yes stop_codon:yes gene_type:complete
MVIKIKTLKANLIFSVLITLCFQLVLMSDEELAKLIPIDSKIDSIESIEDFTDPLEGVLFNLDKRVNKFNKKLTNQNLNNELILQPGEYIQIKGIDNRILLFDGSFLIKFNTFPNLQNFAISNELEFVSNLSDINVGVFKVKNISELQLKIDSIKDDNNIISIQLNTIDPALQPE